MDGRLTVSEKANSDRLIALLRTADRAFSSPPADPLPLATLRHALRRRAAQRSGLAGIAAAVALFSVLARPAPPPPATDVSVPAAADEELAMLEREADAMHRTAQIQLERSERSFQIARANHRDGRPLAASEAAAENAAFILYCEADRLAQQAQTRDAAHERFVTVAQRFPGTIWARMASEMITTSAPIEKG